MNQSTPLEALIKWYGNLPPSRQTEFSRSVIDFVPSIEREVNRSFLGDSSVDIGTWTKEFQSLLEYKHALDVENKLDKNNRNRTETIGLVLCLRTIISFYIKHWGNYDKGLSLNMEVSSLIQQKIRKENGMSEEESSQFIDEQISQIKPRLFDLIEIQESWDDLCRTSLSDEMIYNWFQNTSNK